MRKDPEVRVSVGLRAQPHEHKPERDMARQREKGTGNK